MAIGDALGHPFEFQPAQDRPRGIYFDKEHFKFYGAKNTFRLQRGQWTDDAAMGLCMADSLLLKQKFDGSDMRVRFWCWWYRGYNNAFRKDNSRSSSVGLGGNISKSLKAISTCRTTEAVSAAYEATSEDSGNGSLMRFAPIAIFMQTASDIRQALDVARRSSYTTHPGILAAEACALLCYVTIRALQLPADRPLEPKNFLDRVTAEYLEVSGLSTQSGYGYDQMKCLVTSSPASNTERCWDWRNTDAGVQETLRARGRTYNGFPVSAGYFGSYSLDGLALAFWSFYHTDSFESAVTNSVNLLGDADSHGSITGQIAGAYYGYSSIDPRFFEWLNRWDDYDFAVKGVLLDQLGRASVNQAA